MKTFSGIHRKFTVAIFLMIILLGLIKFNYHNVDVENYIKQEYKQYILLERIITPNGIILLMKENDNFYCFYLKKNLFNWYTAGTSMLNKNESSNLKTSYVSTEYDKIGFTWGVKESDDVKNIVISFDNTKTLINLENRDYWYLFYIEGTTDINNHISVVLKDGTVLNTK